MGIKHFALNSLNFTGCINHDGAHSSLLRPMGSFWDAKSGGCSAILDTGSYCKLMCVSETGQIILLHKL